MKRKPKKTVPSKKTISAPHKKKSVVHKLIPPKILQHLDFEPMLIPFIGKYAENYSYCSTLELLQMKVRKQFLSFIENANMFKIRSFDLSAGPNQLIYPLLTSHSTVSPYEVNFLSKYISSLQSKYPTVRDLGIDIIFEFKIKSTEDMFEILKRIFPYKNNHTIYLDHYFPKLFNILETRLPDFHIDLLEYRPIPFYETNEDEMLVYYLPPEGDEQNSFESVYVSASLRFYTDNNIIEYYKVYDQSDEWISELVSGPFLLTGLMDNTRTSIRRLLEDYGRNLSFKDIPPETQMRIWGRVYE